MKKKEKVNHEKNAKELYEKVGASAVHDYANKHGIPYGYCMGCECEVPALKGECLICGGKIEKDTAEDVLRQIDFNLLKKQKQTLIKVIERTVNNREQKHLEGILVLLDAIQDKAVDEFGLKEEDVFNLEKGK